MGNMLEGVWASWRGLRAVPKWIIPVVFAVFALFLPYIGLDFSWNRQIQLALILALVVGGLNLSLGYGGELALGQAAMYAAGAYTAGILSVHGHTGLIGQLIAGGAVALAVGVITGVPGLRFGSWSLAMTSFFLVLLIPDILSIFRDHTGGHNGLTGLQSPTLFGSEIDSTQLYLVIVVVAIVWFSLLRNLVTSRHGVAFRMLKQSPILASSVGISVFGMKLSSYAIGAIPAGFAGVLFANLDLYISPEAFSFTFATAVLAASILGGSSSVYGAVIGAFVMQIGPNQSTEFEEYALVFYGALLVVCGVLFRGGLSTLGKRIIDRMDRAAGVRPARATWCPESPARGPLIEEVHGAELRVGQVSKSFGGNRALKNATVSARPGEVTALIGPNGSGKTTLLNIVCGYYKADTGRITLGDRCLSGLAPHRVARAGVARTFQTPNVPDDITVLEAVMSGRYTSVRSPMVSAILRLPGFRRVRRDDRREAEKVLHVIGLGDKRDVEATSLPLGNRRLLEVGRSLIAQPSVLLLDEVASGLDEDEVQRLSALVRGIADAGGTVVLVEHNFQLVLSLADAIVVLAQGEVLAQGSPSEIENDSRVMSEYLGVRDDEGEGKVGVHS